MSVIGNLKPLLSYDSTLRDGAQGEGISFTVGDKLNIARKLDEFGIDYIEAGNPGSNPKDMEFFRKAGRLKLKHSKLAAFGSTRRANIRVSEDANVLSLLEAETPVVAIFGKCWDFHVRNIIKTSLEENLSMISDTIAFMKSRGKEVVFDAEHVFDGYKANPQYAISALKAAEDAGADWLVLCDTNGGTLPKEIGDILKRVSEHTVAPLGIHAHNDCGMAVANSVMAVISGATQVQGTMNGYGERCGNANLCTVIPSLQIKSGYDVVPESNLAGLTTLSRYVSEIANKSHNEYDPFVGNYAFAHKGGMHIDAVLKEPASYEHINPELVGNERRLLMSEVSGRSTILRRIQQYAPSLSKDSPEVKSIIERLKKLEHEGYQFEGAESSFELMVKRSLGLGNEFFKVIDSKVWCDNKKTVKNSTAAVIKVEVNGVEEITTAEGDGPINAIDKALRRALELFYPQLKTMRLVDFKVRVLDTSNATAAKVRVHIESTNGEEIWGTVGVSENIIEASSIALIDSIEYFLGEWKRKEKDTNGYDNDTENTGSACLVG
ncbi:MAG TPA: citramalate synthase [Negativicutes bacterium]|nr:citramalate synthase [Negativicutes bacterium]